LSFHGERFRPGHHHTDTGRVNRSLCHFEEFEKNGLTRVLPPTAAAVASIIADWVGTNPGAELFAIIDEKERWWRQINDYCNLCDEVLAEQEGREVLPEDEIKLDEARGI
jgi:hypothetical protein